MCWKYPFLYDALCDQKKFWNRNIRLLLDTPVEKGTLGVLHFRRFGYREKGVLSFLVHPSVHMYHRGAYWEDFREIWYWEHLWKSVEELQISLRPNRNIAILGTMTDVSSSVAINASRTEMYSTTVHKKRIVALTLRPWLRERATILRHTYLALC